MTPKLTIGIPVFDDFTGLFFTVQALRLYHAEAMKQCEIIVVDNNPSSAMGEKTKKFASGLHIPMMKCRYEPFPEKVGTSPPRNRVFELTEAPFALVLDSHVLLLPGAIARLLDYLDKNPETDDLLTGPLVYGSLEKVSTHYDSRWRAGSWGTWQTDPRMIKPEFLVPHPESGKMILNPKIKPSDIPLNTDAEPFEIQAMGLGCFAARKASWLGFHPDNRGFGGGEYPLALKYQKAGRKMLALPWLAWNHLFNHPEGIKYPMSYRDRIGNYMQEFKALGLDLTECRKHYVEDIKAITAEEWDRLLAEKMNGTAPAPRPQPQPIHRTMPPPDLGKLVAAAEHHPGDFAGMIGPIKDLAAKAGSVFVHKADPHIMGVLAASACKGRVLCISTNPNPVYAQLVKSSPDGRVIWAPMKSVEKGLPLKFDLVVVGREHDSAALVSLLKRYKQQATRWLVVTATKQYGAASAMKDTPGLLHGLRSFMKDHPEWSVIKHSTEGNGYTVLSCSEKDKPKLPGMLTLAKNFTAAVAAHVADGRSLASQELMQARLEVCSMCEHRNGSRCSVCGCYLTAAPGKPQKAAWKSSDCPLGLWPKEAAKVTA